VATDDYVSIGGFNYYQFVAAGGLNLSKLYNQFSMRKYI